jgi:hypothetical protein
MHTLEHPNRVAYFVKGGALEITPFDKEKQSNIGIVEDGTTLYLPASHHNIKNTGESETIIIETEIKSLK